MVDKPAFHLVLGGRKVGPYDRRTIVGMRLKHVVSSSHVVIDDEGQQFTVAELIGRWPRGNDFNPNRTGGFSIVQANYPASLLSVAGKGYGIPKFQGEIEMRVQGDVLRVAGRFRERLGWRLDRIKLVINDIVHYQTSGSCVEIWMRIGDNKPMQRAVFELFTPEMAAELTTWLTNATPWPEPAAPAAAPASGHHSNVMLWVLVLMSRRHY